MVAAQRAQPVQGHPEGLQGSWRSPPAGQAGIWIIEEEAQQTGLAAPGAWLGCPAQGQSLSTQLPGKASVLQHIGMQQRGAHDWVRLDNDTPDAAR